MKDIYNHYITSRLDPSFLAHTGEADRAMKKRRDSMKRYLVFLTDLALAPLTGQTRRGGKIQNFDDLSAAQSFAESEKGHWDRVFIFDRAGDGELERLEHYKKGRKYPGDVR